MIHPCAAIPRSSGLTNIGTTQPGMLEILANLAAAPSLSVQSHDMAAQNSAPKNG